MFDSYWKNDDNIYNVLFITVPACLSLDTVITDLWPGTWMFCDRVTVWKYDVICNHEPLIPHEHWGLGWHGISVCCDEACWRITNGHSVMATVKFVRAHNGCRSWWRHQMETFSALLAISVGNSTVPGEFPTQRPVTRSFDVFLNLRLNKRLSKQSRGCWLETLSRPLWRHRNVVGENMNIIQKKHSAEPPCKVAFTGDRSSGQRIRTLIRVCKKEQQRWREGN